MTRENRKRPGRPSAPPQPVPAKGDATEALLEGTVVEQLPPITDPDGTINEVIRFRRQPTREPKP